MTDTTDTTDATHRADDRRSGDAAANGESRERRSTRQRGTTSRRRYLAAAGAVGATSLAGCLGWIQGEDDDPEPGLIGSGREGRDDPGGTPMAEMSDLEGTLTVYSGRGEFLVGDLFGAIEERYEGFEIDPQYNSSTDLVNRIRTEDETPADVFFTVNSGALGFLAGEGHTRALPDDVLELGREGYQDPDGQWIGTSGRARAIPYNTDSLGADDVPDDVLSFPDEPAFEDDIGWAPTYGSFQDFVTAMRILNDDETARQWLEAMLDHGAQEYSSEFAVAQAVADGEVAAGLTNHYYVVRVLDGRDGAPIDMTFTDGDAASFFNVAGASVMDATDQPDLAANFVRHLLSAEAQEYFAVTRTFEYPMIPEVEPLEELPGFDELNPPDIDLAEFATADVTETTALMEDAGVL